MPSGRDLEEETRRIAEEEEKFVLAKWAFVRGKHEQKLDHGTKKRDEEGSGRESA